MCISEKEQISQARDKFFFMKVGSKESDEIIEV